MLGDSDYLQKISRLVELGCRVLVAKPNKNRSSYKVGKVCETCIFEDLLIGEAEWVDPKPNPILLPKLRVLRSLNTKFCELLNQKLICREDAEVKKLEEEWKELDKEVLEVLIEKLKEIVKRKR